MNTQVSPGVKFYNPLVRRTIANLESLLKSGCIYIEGLEEPQASTVPLIKRCRCGKKISGNKARCQVCQVNTVVRLAEQVRDVEHLEKVLAGMDPEERSEALRIMKPHLKFAQVGTEAT